MSRNGMGFWGETWQTARAVAWAMTVTLKNLFRKPVTVHYPDVVRPYPDRLRGLLALVYDKTGEEACIGCRLCGDAWPPPTAARCCSTRTASTPWGSSSKIPGPRGAS